MFIFAPKENSFFHSNPIIMESNDKVRLLVVDDHALFRLGLRLVLQEDGARCVIASECDTVENAVNYMKTETDKFDLVLCDYFLADGTARDVLETFNEVCPEKKFVVISGDAKASVIYWLSNHGINAFIHKDVQPEDLQDILVSVMQGNNYVGKDSKLLWPKMREDLELIEQLSEREIEILQLSALGFNASKVANVLNLSKRTIENHKERIFAKIGATTTAEMQTIAYRWGLTR